MLKPESSAAQPRTNPLQQTKRSRLQQKRSSINEQISKELRLKSGAENLLRATGDSGLKQQISLELSFLHSNISLLREQLSDLNSALTAYQHERSVKFLPLIPLALKETKHVDFALPLKDFILEHYSEDGKQYEDAMERLSQLRFGATQSPSKDAAGVELLLRYFYQLQFVHKRFFPPNRHLGIYFEWFDALTGQPSMQRSLAFEKASVLFNVAALQSQIGAKEERTSAESLRRAIERFCDSAGCLLYLRDHFTNAPSSDLQSETVSALAFLMMAQSRELYLDQTRLRLCPQPMDLDAAFAIAQESAQVSLEFSKTADLLDEKAVRDSVPEAWFSLCRIKRDHYKALAHFWTAKGVLCVDEMTSNVRRLFRSHFVERREFGRGWDPREPLTNDKERRQLAARHLQFALSQHEEVLIRIQSSAELRRLSNLLRSLIAVQKSTEKLLTDLCSDQHQLDLLLSEECADVARQLPSGGLLGPHLAVSARSQAEVAAVYPDFSQSPEQDLFAALGPLSFFSAKRQWSVPRWVEMRLGRLDAGFGFSIRGDAPVVVSGVEAGGVAERAGLIAGDVIVAVGGRGTKWMSHEALVELIRKSGTGTLALAVVRERHDSFLSSAHSSSTLSSSNTSGSPSASLAVKFRPSYFSQSRKDLTQSSAEPKKKRPWRLRKLLHNKKLSRSEPDLLAAPPLDLFCRSPNGQSIVP